MAGYDGSQRYKRNVYQASWSRGPGPQILPTLRNNYEILTYNNTLKSLKKSKMQGPVQMLWSTVALRCIIYKKRNVVRGSRPR
ncbi:hypothetical protein PAAG_05793 [Paracoccidioides lutzii Pb01]|uniref:Uncharacterized protein n=1 Tax=Paracoccidioides lutzii (strain ATCC MYA-826 / Pb01) TaxID=502779 RepID=C1H4V2_PARBA|nr:hypothetical protein PAAG_05793 [Paracoccidioides lutzii Pb01]EEH34746.2 hypothetical protein PAAG_05793 [Paracoccidioides lutzii Pb01]